MRPYLPFSKTFKKVYSNDEKGGLTKMIKFNIPGVDIVVQALGHIGHIPLGLPLLHGLNIADTAYNHYKQTD